MTDQADNYSIEIIDEEVNMTGKIHTELQKQRDYLKEAGDKHLDFRRQAHAGEHAKYRL